MKNTFAIVAAAMILAGCGQAPGAVATRVSTTVAAQAKANPFLGLTKLEAGPGGDQVKKHALSHFSAKTKMGGYLRLEDMGDVTLAFYNFDEISVPVKIAQIGAALEEAAATADPAMAKTVQDIRAKFLAPNPYLGLKDVKFVDGPPPNAPFWHLAKRHVAATTADGGNLCLVEQKDVAYMFGIVRNGTNVNDGRTRHFAVEGYMQALPTVTDPETAMFIKEHIDR